MATSKATSDSEQFRVRCPPITGEMAASPMSSRQQSRLGFGITIESQTGPSTSPSAIFTDLRSPNSWAARSFSTLGPSDSPSQAQFPKHSQASLLLRAQTERAHPNGRKVNVFAAKNQAEQPSFIKRNCRFVVLTIVFQTALIGITIITVLIITDAKSIPKKRIKPGYYVGMMLLFSLAIATLVIGYVKWNERKVLSRRRNELPASQQQKHPNHMNELNRAEFGLIAAVSPSPFPPSPSPLDDTRAIVSNWEPSRVDANARQCHLKNLLVAGSGRCPPTLDPSAAAHIAGSANNRAFNNPPPQFLSVTEQQQQGGIELASLSPYHQPRVGRNNNDSDGGLQQQQQNNNGATNMALEIQRCIDLELQRQEFVKRRISRWLKGVVSPPRPHHNGDQQLSQRAHHRRHHRRNNNRHHHHHNDGGGAVGGEANTFIPSNPLRLAHLTAEIEAYIGHPIPRLPLAAPPVGVGGEEWQYGDPNINYEALPPAISRPGAKARDVVLSDPTTVVYVGQGPDPRGRSDGGMRGGRAGVGGKEGKGKGKEVEGRMEGEGCGVGGEGEASRGIEVREGSDDYAEKWVEGIVRGVDVGVVGKGRGKGKGKKRGKVGKLRFW